MSRFFGQRLYRIVMGLNAKTVNFLGGRKLEVCFYLLYLYFNELIGYVDLLDFHENLCA